MRNKKIIFLISGEIFYRNYVHTGIIDFLSGKFKNVEVLLHDELEMLQAVKCKIYQTNKLHEKRHYQYLKILSWRHRKLSRTFRFRFLRTSQFKKLTFADLGDVQKVKRILIKNFRSALRRLKILILSNFLVFPFTRYFFEQRLNPDIDIEEYIKSSNPNAVVMPSSAYDPAVLDIISICQKHKIKSILLIDNWDNLSSKSILWRRPDTVAVWGRQTKKHAVEIQGLEEHQVKCIGTPRFEKYFQSRDKKLRSHFEFKYVLFVGQSLPSNEVSIVKIINNILCSPMFRDAGIKLVYRPHPWAMNQRIAEVDELEAVIIDPQIDARDKSLKKVEQFQPDLDYYPSLLQNAEFVVSALTSMIIEASILRKTVIAIAHTEPDNVTSPHRLLKEYRHFEEIEKLPNLSISFTPDDLLIKFRSLLTSPEKVDEQSLELELTNFLTMKGTYNDRLLALLDENI